MNFKIALLTCLILISLPIHSQDWKVYPYTPTTTPASQIVFPVDEGRHTDPVEWWYTSGWFTGNTSGAKYSFMLTYFYYPQTLGPFSFDGFRILNVTNETTGAFYQDTQPLNYSNLSTTHLDIAATLPTGAEFWKNKVDGSTNPIPFEYELQASSSNINIQFDLETTKRPLIVGGDGLFDQGLGNYTYYYSQTYNALSGSFTLEGSTETVTGNAWIDRQYGDFNPFIGEDYEWFSIQLDNGTDLNFWNIFNTAGEIPNNPKYLMLSAYVDESTQYVIDDITIERLEYFKTGDNAKNYSKKWRLTSASKNLGLTITANHTTTEVNITQLAFRFFEGSITVSGTDSGVPVTGVGFAELLHSYEDPEVSLTSPSGGVYNTASPITWALNNPDAGRPIQYDLEYSTDNKATFTPIVSGLTSTSYTWDGTGLNNDDAVWFKVKAYSVDNTLKSEIISASSNSVTLSNSSFKTNSLKLYPNPVQKQLILELKKPLNNGDIQIIDINGKVTLSSKTVKAQNIKRIDVQSLPQGIYFLRVTSHALKQTLKFVKK